MIYKKKKCLRCNKLFDLVVYNKKYCTSECLHRHYGQQDIKTISVSTIGAISELLVAADLLKRGYDTYRATSPTSMSDLVAISRKLPHKIYTIEVRTGYYHPATKKLYYGKKNIKSDVVAVVTQNNNEIVFIPEGML